ncbi:P-loop containing nucleoside triphosphate hydrolase protein [Ceratobasidium sp. AG-I]|nr:P-loop containing nucleoside triphosphate hydrolase protein [Ceratobasidium sp. AG-I]
MSSPFEKLRKLFYKPKPSSADCGLPSPDDTGSSMSSSGLKQKYEQANPMPLDFCLKAVDQLWDHDKDEWVEVHRNAHPLPWTPLNKIILYNRKDSRRSYYDHIWVEIRSKPLASLLKPYLQKLTDFSGVHPGVDARHVYSQRKVLSALVDEPTKPGGMLDDMSAARLELKLLLERIDSEFQSVTDQLEILKTDGLIKWDLLWALFSKGDLVEAKLDISGEPMALELDSWSYYRPYESEPCFEVAGHILQWNGRRYVTVQVERKLERFSGFRRLNSLSVKPMTSQKRDDFTARGKHYIKLTGVHHLNYETNVMWKKRQATCIELADGRVMIDAMSFRRFNPNWDPFDVEDLHESCPEGDDWLTSLDETYDKLYLLPPTVHGWSFVAKKWGEFSVERLSKIPFNANVFSQLVLPVASKNIIRCLVEAQVGLNGMSLMKDVVAGKGAGLVMLFHGNPGTGKTLTAEAVSEHLKLPLYSVSCSEFGTDPEKVEERLRQILEITSLWKAVVLIDEADIFLEQRSEDIARNAIVGVFLRMLEYHAGIVILTTNRVRTLDEAFQSRISLALKYHDLDQLSRQILWRKFLLLASAKVESEENAELDFDFSVADITRLSQRAVNGRGIKTVTRTAQALAASTQESIKPSHIEEVWKIMDEFEADLMPTLSTRGASTMSS